MNLVNELLDLSKLDAGRTELQMSTFSLETLLDTELRQQDPIAHAKGLLLRREGSVGGIWLHTDKMKLARVLSNLLGNAVKFTDSGVVSIQCTRTSSGHIDLFIRDTGPGIPPEQVPRIFDEFYQVRNPSATTKRALAWAWRSATASSSALAAP